MKYGLSTLVLVLIAGTAWAFINPASFKKSVKTTIVIETPEGEVSGSAVRQISNEAPLVDIDWPHGGNPAEVSGEAVVIDLGEKGKLFALIDGSDTMYRFYQAFPPPAHHSDAESIRFFDQLPLGAKAKVNENRHPSYPTFVRFADMQDPTSVQVVYQTQQCRLTEETRKKGCKTGRDYYTAIDKFEEFYGPEYRIKYIELEITDESKTQTGILGVA